MLIWEHVYCGISFRRTPGFHLAMVEGLIQQHPGLRFALQGKKEWLSRLSAENDLHLSFINRVNAVFVDDAEAEELIEHIF